MTVCARASSVKGCRTPARIKVSRYRYLPIPSPSSPLVCGAFSACSPNDPTESTSHFPAQTLRAVLHPPPTPGDFLFTSTRGSQCCPYPAAPQGAIYVTLQQPLPVPCLVGPQQPGIYDHRGPYLMPACCPQAHRGPPASHRKADTGVATSLTARTTTSGTPHGTPRRRRAVSVHKSPAAAGRRYGGAGPRYSLQHGSTKAPKQGNITRSLDALRHFQTETLIPPPATRSVHAINRSGRGSVVASSCTLLHVQQVAQR